jgi:uncharacterized membrane protein YqjE
LSPDRIGSFDALRRLGAAALALGRIKLELLALEWQDEKARIAQLLVLAVVGALLGGFALIALAITLTVVLWDTSYRVLALGITTALLAAGALGSAWRAMVLLRGPSPLSGSVGELRRDEAALRGDGGRDGA